MADRGFTPSDSEIEPESGLEEEQPEQEQEIPEPIPVPETIPEPVASNKWDWIGSPSRPEAKEHSDGISDLFTVDAEDVGASDEDLSDLTDVDMEHDILDADDDGTLDDLVDVTEDDIMGDERGQRPSRPSSQQPRTRRRNIPRYQPPTSMGRSG